MKCDMCGKSPLFGHNVSHYKRRTNTRSLPNVHSVVVVIEGERKRLNLCTRCQRTQLKTA